MQNLGWFLSNFWLPICMLCVTMICAIKDKGALTMLSLWYTTLLAMLCLLGADYSALK